MEKVKSKFRSKVDEYQNKILIKNNGKSLVLSLKLADEKKSRRLGVINISQKVLTVHRKPQHLLYTANSYGFNYQLLADAKKFNWVRIITNYGEFKIPRLKLLELGKFLFFKQQGFERQIFISLTELAAYKRSAKY